MFTSYFDVAYVIDDSKIINKLHSKIIQKLNITKEIKNYDNPIDALKNLVTDLVEKKATLVLLDLDMPNLNGADLLEVISALNLPSSQLSIYVISSTIGDYLHREIMYNKYIKRHIQKPLKKEDLVFRQLRVLYNRNVIKSKLG
jgi:response regulator RpfG family c-di-GMP phosphodiesterase